MRGVKNIRLLTVSFDFKLGFNEINYFRGAVIKTTKGKNDLFHNHSPNGTIYRYPLIQYKSLNKKAVLLCIERGIEGVQDFFASTDWKLDIGSRTQPISVENIRVRQHKVGIWDKTFQYSLFRWLPLNQDNYKKYHQVDNFNEKKLLLEKILLANVLSFLEGINLFVEEKIEIKILHILNQRLENYKGQEMESFKIRFISNLSLPNYIGLGKGSGSGFGVIKEETEKHN